MCCVFVLYEGRVFVDLLVNTQPSVPGLVQCPCINTRDHSLQQAENCAPPREHTAISTRAHSVDFSRNTQSWQC